METLTCRFCGDQMPAGDYEGDAQSTRRVLSFVIHHSRQGHALSQAEQALERGDLHAALLALLWVVRERTEDVQHIPAVYRVEVTR